MVADMTGVITLLLYYAPGLDGPSVDLVLEGSEVDEGARVELSCPFTANPHDSARVTWLVAHWRAQYIIWNGHKI